MMFLIASRVSDGRFELLVCSRESRRWGKKENGYCVADYLAYMIHM